MIFIIKMLWWAKIMGGKGRTILLATAELCPSLTPVNPSRQRLLQPNYCQGQGHEARESTELPGLILVQKCALSMV